MKVLLDTNILINRENPREPQLAVNRLIYAIDEFGYQKFIHPASIEELNHYKDKKQRNIMLAKLEAYQKLSIRPELPADYLHRLRGFANSGKNNIVDNELLYQIFDGRIDYLITEDRVMRKKAEVLNISERVFSIEGFLNFYVESFPKLADYKMLSIKKTKFAEHDLHDVFFDSFRDDYPGFNEWFKKKSNEEVYTFYDNQGLSGFLYLKDENENENYSTFNPSFKPAKRLKIGTFKVVQSGFRIGERFIKIIFDNAKIRKSDEIYVTLFQNRPELERLKQLFLDWGFCEYGINYGTGETVLVKKMNNFIPNQTPMFNFPFFSKEARKMFLPIDEKYHTNLFPDSILNIEEKESFDSKQAYEYAIKKVYISWAPTNDAKPGDLILIYRMGGKYKGVLTTICILDEIIVPHTKDELLRHCQNRSIFKKEELESFWQKKGRQIKVVKLLYLKSFTNRLILAKLWDYNIVEVNSGPRPFMKITPEQYRTIVELSKNRNK